MYVQIDTKTKQIKKTYSRIPNKFTFPDGTQTGNFSDMPTSVHEENGFFPMDEVKPSYDSSYQRLEGADIYDESTKRAKRVFTAVDQDIDALKNQKKTAINSKRQVEATISCAFRGKTIYCTEQALNAIARKTAAYSFSNSAALGNVTWYCDDGTTLDLDATGLKELQLLLEQKDQALRDAKRTHQIAIDALKTAKDVAEYDVESGWA